MNEEDGLLGEVGASVVAGALHDHAPAVALGFGEVPYREETVLIGGDGWRDTGWGASTGTGVNRSAATSRAATSASASSAPRTGHSWVGSSAM